MGRIGQQTEIQGIAARGALSERAAQKQASSFTLSFAFEDFERVKTHVCLVKVTNTSGITTQTYQGRRECRRPLQGFRILNPHYVFLA